MILLAIPAVLLTVVSVAAFFGRWSWVLDVLSNFRVQYAIALLFMAAFLFTARWTRMGAIALLGAAINGAVILPLYLGEGRTVAPEEPLRIMSFNLLASNAQFGEVVAYLREIRADVIFLHEASRPWEMALQGTDLPYEVTRSRSLDLDYGTLVLSRPGDPVISYGFTLGGARAVQVTHDGVAVLGAHPLAPTSSRRSALRNAQLEFATDWAQQQTGPHVVTGDFNATPWSYAFRRMLADSDLENSQVGFGVQGTFPADRFFLIRLPIDHLLHSPELAVVDRRRGPRLGSDHFPLIVDLWQPG